MIKSIGADLVAAHKDTIEKAMEFSAINLYKLSGGKDLKQVADEYDIGLNRLEHLENPIEGTLIVEALIIGEKATKKVVDAYIIKTGCQLVEEGEGFAKVALFSKFKQSPESFKYPDDDALLFKKKK